MATTYSDVPLHLDASTNIRLLEIIHDPTGDHTTVISCNLYVVALEDSPKYTALSYVWGPPTPTREILVNGKPFTVRENLWNFLHQARKDCESRVLWMDAICIDQASDAERTHQVSIMGKIYLETELVVAWLGTATKYSAQWFRALNTIPAFNDDNHGNFKRWYKVYGPCILDLCNSPYWNRLWIVQEYTLARRVTIQCGVCRTSDESLSRFFEEWACTSKFDRVKKRPGFYYTFARKVDFSRRRINKHKQFRNLGSLISSFIDSECMDPRDRVYGLLAMCDPIELAQSSIRPDYSKSILELYTQLVHAFMNLEYYNYGWGLFYVEDILPAVLRIGKPELDHLTPETMHTVE